MISSGLRGSTLICPLRQVLRPRPRRVLTPGQRNVTLGCRRFAVTSLRWLKGGRKDDTVIRDGLRGPSKQPVSWKLDDHRQSTEESTIADGNKHFEMKDTPDTLEREQKSHREAVANDGSAVTGGSHGGMEHAQELSSEKQEIKSIESLRPETIMMDDAQYAKLFQALKQAYSTGQLLAYLRKSVHMSSSGAESVMPQPATSPVSGFQRSSWRVGRTTLDERHCKSSLGAEGDAEKRKGDVIRQILRFWMLGNVDEWQCTGEIELTMKSWQLSYLFDQHYQNKPIFEMFLNSPELSKHSKIRAYPPDNIVRISARRLDADLIADRIEQGIRNLQRLEVGLQAVTGIIGDAYEPDLAELCKNVGRRTATVIEVTSKELVVILGSSITHLRAAQQMLCSLLQLPSSDTVVTLPPHDIPAQVLDLQNGEGQSAGSETYRSAWRISIPRHAEDRETLGRVTDCSSLALSTSYPAYVLHAAVLAGRERDPVARSLADYMSNLNDFEPSWIVPKKYPSSVWTLKTPVKPRRWQIQFCKMLPPMPEDGILFTTTQTTVLGENDTSTSQMSSCPSPLQATIPHLTELLSYFAAQKQPGDGNTKDLLLMARFVPSLVNGTISTDLQNFPSVEVFYELFDNNTLSGIANAQARLASQELRVPLPEEAVDLRFWRDIRLYAKSDSFGYLGLDRFTEIVQEALKAGRTVAPGTEVKIMLPAWAIAMMSPGGNKALTANVHVEVEYMLARYELVHDMKIVPCLDQLGYENPMFQPWVGDVPTGVHLRHCDFDGGDLVGQRKELTMAYTAEPKRERGSGTYSGPMYELVRVGFGIARAITRLQAGELKPAWEAPVKGVRQTQVLTHDEIIARYSPLGA